jgi:hypothetical protein
LKFINEIEAKIMSSNDANSDDTKETPDQLKSIQYYKNTKHNDDDYDDDEIVTSTSSFYITEDGAYVETFEAKDELAPLNRSITNLDNLLLIDPLNNEQKQNKHGVNINVNKDDDNNSISPMSVEIKLKNDYDKIVMISSSSCGANDDDDDNSYKTSEESNKVKQVDIASTLPIAPICDVSVDTTSNPSLNSFEEKKNEAITYLAWDAEKNDFVERNRTNSDSNSQKSPHEPIQGEANILVNNAKVQLSSNSIKNDLQLSPESNNNKNDSPGVVSRLKNWILKPVSPNPNADELPKSDIDLIKCDSKKINNANDLNQILPGMRLLINSFLTNINFIFK